MLLRVLLLLLLLLLLLSLSLSPSPSLSPPPPGPEWRVARHGHGKGGRLHPKDPVYAKAFEKMDDRRIRRGRRLAAASAPVRAQSPLVGVGALVLAALCTAFASVYFEKMLKGASKPSLWLRNIQARR